jgi:hypothetical protein
MWKSQGGERREGKRRENQEEEGRGKGWMERGTQISLIISSVRTYTSDMQIVCVRTCLVFLLLLAGAGYDIIDTEDQTSTGREREGEGEREENVKRKNMEKKV